MTADRAAVERLRGLFLTRRAICRREGHRVHPDPGDFVLYCTRCHAMVDMHTLLATAAGDGGGVE